VVRDKNSSRNFSTVFHQETPSPKGKTTVASFIAAFSPHVFSEYWRTPGEV
jgi:hypothetical protein